MARTTWHIKYVFFCRCFANLFHPTTSHASLISKLKYTSNPALCRPPLTPLTFPNPRSRSSESDSLELAQRRSRISSNHPTTLPGFSTLSPLHRIISQHQILHWHCECCIHGLELSLPGKPFPATIQPVRRKSGRCLLKSSRLRIHCWLMYVWWVEVRRDQNELTQLSL